MPKVVHKDGTNDITSTFDVDKIIMSLNKETTLTENEIFAVVRQFFISVIPTGIKMLTAPEIREKLCSILLDMGYRKARLQYTRIGMPYADFDRLLNENRDLDWDIVVNEAFSRILYEYGQIKARLEGKVNMPD